MDIRFKDRTRETVLSFFKNDVACCAVYLKNGDSFTFYNDSFKPLSYNPKNENVIMQAVCVLNEKLCD